MSDTPTTPEMPERIVYRNRADRQDYVHLAYVRWLEDEFARLLDAVEEIHRLRPAGGHQ